MDYQPTDLPKQMKRKAKQLAEKAHEGQRRKFEGQPFVEHPKAVALLVQRVTDATEEMVAAALLHDVVEDTEVEIGEIEDRFGKKVAKFVQSLTTNKEKRDEFGKAAYLGHKMAGMEDKTLIIKLCDRYHNVKRIDETPEKFRTRYSTETMETLSILTKNRDLNITQKHIVSEIIKKVS